jgi:DNA-binding transcriptional MerR regulator
VDVLITLLLLLLLNLLSGRKKEKSAGLKETLLCDSKSVYNWAMKENERTFNLDELSSLTEQSKRTIRYYIQVGLLEKPIGVGRGSHYNTQHLNQLLEIRKWQQAGLSLERIQKLISEQSDIGLVPPKPPRKPGSVEVRNHVVIGESVELMIEPTRADLSPEQVRALAKAVMVQFSRIKNGEGEEQ